MLQKAPYEQLDTDLRPLFTSHDSGKIKEGEREREEVEEKKFQRLNAYELL